MLGAGGSEGTSGDKVPGPRLKPNLYFPLEQGGHWDMFSPQFGIPSTSAACLLPPSFPNEPLKLARGEAKLVLEPVKAWVAQVCCAREQVCVFTGWNALWGAPWWTVIPLLSVFGCFQVSVCGGCLFLGGGGCVWN